MTARRAATAPADATRSLLEGLRDTLLAAIAEAREAGSDKQAQIAPLAKQLRDTLDAIAHLPAAQKSKVDDLAKRRARRLAGAQVPARPAGKVNSGTRSGGAGGKRGADPRPVAKPRARGSTSRSA